MLRRTAAVAQHIPLVSAPVAAVPQNRGRAAEPRPCRRTADVPQNCGRAAVLRPCRSTAAVSQLEEGEVVSAPPCRSFLSYTSPMSQRQLRPCRRTAAVPQLEETEGSLHSYTSPMSQRSIGIVVDICRCDVGELDL